MGANVNDSIEALCNKLGEFISSKTVVGEAVTVGEVTLIPLIEVTFGMGAGGGNQSSNKNGCGGGMGAKVTPNAVIAIIKGNVQLINIKNQDALNKIIDLAPAIANKLNFSSAFNKMKKENELNDDEID